MKKLLAIFLVLLLLMSSIPTIAEEAESAMLYAENLQTEYLTDPLGIDESVPRLSWSIAGGRRAVMQTAYRIIVSKSKNNILGGTGEVWDSGKTSSDQSIGIEYGGAALESKTAYYWAVQVWDNYGNVSDFSEPAYFETAMLSGEWEAKWITSGDNGYPHVNISFDEPISVRYVRINTSRLGERVDGWGESGYRLQLAEMQVIEASTGENVALNKAVSSAQSFTNDTWAPQYLTDGKFASDTAAQGFTSQMYGSADTNVIVTIDLGDTYSINGVVLYPRNDTQSVNPHLVPSFPRSYKIECSSDNVNFASAYSVENVEVPSFEDSKGLPVFYKIFTVNSEKSVESARAYASGLGLFEMHIGGGKVTDAVLEPGETNFDKKAFYVTYDITDKIVPGENAVNVYMGKGFYYNPTSEGRYNRSPKIWGPLMLLAQIEIKYTDGTKDVISTDESWTYASGPVRESVWLGGEDYDANYETEYLSAWNNAEIVPESDYPFEWLESKMYPSLKVVDTAEAESVTEIINSDGTKSYTVKFSRNFAGRYSFTADFPKGTKITFRPAEHINSDGTVNQGSTIMWDNSGKIYDTYTFNGKGEQTYIPKFVYHGFQYLQIDGAPEAVTADMFKGLVVRCDNEVAGSLSASDENVTAVHNMITNSISDNMYNVITDCPHREKLGWLEVSHLLYQSIANNFNVAAYMEKISDDMIDAQKDSGSIPSIVPPLTVGKSEHALRDNSDDDTPNDPTWSGASIMVPWYSYLTYGDARQLEKAWPSMEKYFDYLSSLVAKSGTECILESGDLNRDLGDWLSLESTNVTFVVTCTYYQLACTMANAAEALSLDASKYAALAENIKNAINEKYFNSAAASYDSGSQTANALPLYLGLVPEGYETLVAKNLADKVAGNSYHLSSGEVGLKAVFNELSEYGYSDYAYKMIMNPTAPSYYYFVSQGKTTLPEEWSGGASQDHCMAGHGEGWLYEYLGGIRNDGVAYKNSIVAPYMAEELTSFEASVKTAYGTISSDWSKNDDETVMNVTIPANTTSKIYFPVRSSSKIFENGTLLSQVEGVKRVYTENGNVVAEVGSGSYSFTMPTEKPLGSPETNLTPSVTAKGGANPEYAIDEDISTAFVIADQTESAFADQYIQFELSGTEAVNKIVIKKQKVSLGGNTTYWGDHAYAVGCVLEGSLDGEVWETIFAMPKNADGLDNQSEVTIELENPKVYKYVRYIRKEKNGYITWAENGGNKLILADIEFYALKLTVGSCFADNMVIQRNENIVVSGSGADGAQISVTIMGGDQSVQGSALVEDGKWRVEIENTLPAGTGYIMTVTAGEVGIEYKNIAIGDVYLLAGQSNMERMISLLGDASPANGVTNPANSNIRFFNYYKGYAETDGGNGSTVPLDDPMYNTWSIMASQNMIKEVSAVGFYFADEVQRSEGVPIGLYSVAVGGTAIDKWLPGGELYNSRIYPFRDMAISGILWYQGEQDAIEKMTSDVYAEKMARLIDEYRALWQTENLPFYYAELMRIESWKGQDNLKYDFSEIRSGQTKAIGLVKNKANLGIVPTLDIYGNYYQNTTFRDAEGRIWTGNARTDIHPWNKQEIAARFAAFVLRDIYGRSTSAEGPSPVKAITVGNRIVISFDCTESLRIADPANYMDETAALKLTSEQTSVLQEFEVSEDGVNWYPAQTNIFGEKYVEVYSENVENPSHVRYAHSAYPEMPNLTDSTGLPPINFEIAADVSEDYLCLLQDNVLNIVSSRDSNGSVIFSLYTDDGALDKVKTISTDLNMGVNTVEVPADFVNTEFSAMLWKSLEDLTPLCGKIKNNKVSLN